MNNVTYVLFAVCIVFAFVIVAAPPAFAVHSISDSPGGGVTDVPAGAEYRFHFNTTGVQDDESESWTAVSTEASCTTNGAAIDSGGVFTWTPVIADVGKTCGFQIIATAVNAGGDSHNSFPTFQFMVTSPPNVAPVITLPIPDFDDTPRVGQIVTIDFAATDTESDTLEWAIVGPASFGQTIDSQTGLLTWTPRAEDVGTRIFSISVTDNVNDAVMHELTFTVAVNRLPTIQPPNNIVNDPFVDQDLEFDFDFTDDDGDTVRWLTPTGMSGYHDDGTVGLIGQTLDQNGVFRWTPTPGQAGQMVGVSIVVEEEHQIVRVATGRILESANPNVAIYDLRFNVQNRAPVIEFPDIPTRVIAGQSVSSTLSATDEDGHSPIFTTIAPTDLGATITAGGLFEWTPDVSHIGTHEFTFTATDNSPRMPRETSRTHSITVLANTPENRMPTFEMYEPTVSEGMAIPSLSGAVSDPFPVADPPPEYRIFKPGDLPDYIVLDPATGNFLDEDGEAVTFPFDTTASSTTLFFSWTYINQDGESPPQLGSITVNNNPDLVPTVTRGNEGYDIEEYRFTVIDDGPIPPLSTVVTDYPTEPAETPIYTIVDPGNLPAFVFGAGVTPGSFEDSLDADTGAFSATFACDSARVGIPIVYTFDWTFADSTGESDVQRGTITSQINSRGACITSVNEPPEFRIYAPENFEGETPQSLSIAVSNPPENPIDRTSIYTITDPGSGAQMVPQYIVDSLDPQTGDFAAQINCDPLLPVDTTYRFAWTFEDGTGVSPTQGNGQFRVNPNPVSCVPITDVNEVPTSVPYRQEVLEGQPIPRLSTAITNPFEDPADEVSEYIISSGIGTVTVPDYIVDSLNSATGGFDEVFRCDTVSAGSETTFDLDFAFRDTRATVAALNSVITVIDDPNCMTPITPGNDVPEVSVYTNEVGEGQPIPSLSTAVFDPPESSVDSRIRYNIDGGTFPASYSTIAGSLDPLTGDFGAVFDCGTTNAQIFLRFNWTYTDTTDTYNASSSFPSSLTVNNDPNCRSPENDRPIVVPYNREIDEGQPIPSLSTVVFDPPEDSIDIIPIYTITTAPATQSDLANLVVPRVPGLPQLIQESLDPQTGRFSQGFSCDTPIPTIDGSIPSRTFVFEWTYDDGSYSGTPDLGMEGNPGSGSESVPIQMSTIQVNSNDQCNELITPQNDLPDFSTYFSTVRPDRPIPGLSMAVMDLEEDPPDDDIAYRIVNPGNMPAGITGSLDRMTGEFSRQFDDSYLTDVDSRSFVFTWSYQDENREYEPRTAVLILADNSGGSGSSNDWKKKPTFGKSWEISSSQLVTDGFTFNDYTLDITDNWHTEFRRTSSIIGETNSVTLKAFSPDGFSYVALSLGVPEIGMATDAETDIILMLERNYENPDDYEITEIIHEQKESLVDESQTTATVTKVLCNPRDAIPCYSFDINFKVDAPLKSDVLAISAVDFKRRSTTTYINEGVEFTGDAILAPNTHLMVQKKTNQGPAEMLTLVQQDRRYNIWEDDSGYLWAQNDHGSWFSITAPEMERFEDRAVNVMTRMHSNFDSLKHDERQKATMMFDASKLVSVPDATFNYDYSGISYGVSKMDQLAEELNIEQGKAQKIMELLR